MKKILHSEKFLPILLILLLVALLVPMLWIAPYNVPSADDFSHSNSVKNVLAEGGSAVDVLKVAMKHSLGFWHYWSGVYVSDFYSALSPHVFGMRYYTLVPWLMLLSLLFGLYCFVDALYGVVFRASFRQKWILFATLAIIYTQFLPGASQGFYWYSGAVNYTFSFGLTLIAWALVIQIVFCGSNFGKVILLSVLLVLTGGSNLISGLLTAVLLSVCELFLIWQKKTSWKSLLIPIILFYIAFALNVFAPGNAVRQSTQISPGIFRAMIMAFSDTKLGLYEWLTLPVLGIMLLLIPLLSEMASNTDFCFPYPWVVSILSFILIAVMNFPSLYATNWRGPTRVVNLVYFVQIFLLLFNLFYWVGWIQKRGFRVAFPVWVFAFAAGMILFGCCFTLKVPITSISAAKSYLSGEAGNYRHRWKQRYEILEDPEVKEVVVPQNPFHPYVLFVTDLAEDENLWVNVAIAQYFGKDSLRVETP